jgi:hypothetical protein
MPVAKVITLNVMIDWNLAELLTVVERIIAHVTAGEADRHVELLEVREIDIAEARLRLEGAKLHLEGEQLRHTVERERLTLERERLASERERCEKHYAK